jgi:hypothetical protein
MYVRLAFAVAAHLEPEILLVDEVLAVGDAAFQKKCLGKMGDVILVHPLPDDRRETAENRGKQRWGEIDCKSNEVIELVGGFIRLAGGCWAGTPSFCLCWPQQSPNGDEKML